MEQETGQQLEEPGDSITVRPADGGPGPGTAHTSPGMLVSQSVPGGDLSREVDAIERAMAERGPTERRELARAVGARFWGPGRFGAALGEAVESGRAKRAGRNHYQSV